MRSEDRKIWNILRGRFLYSLGLSRLADWRFGGGFS